MLDNTRLEAQEASLRAWANLKGKGIVVMPPRMGKTKVGCIAIEKLVNKTSNAKILIIVTSDTIRTQWKGELASGYTFRDSSILVHTKNEVINNILPVPSVFDLVIIDEIHKFLTDKGRDILAHKYYETKFELGLTGSIDSELFNYLPLAFTISEKTAIDKGWITNYSEYNIGVDLTEEERLRYKDYNNYIKDILQTFSGSLKALCEWRPDIPFKKVFEDDFALLLSCASGKPLPNGKYLQASDIRHDIAYARGWDVNLPHNAINDEIDRYFNPNNLAEYATTFQQIVRKRNGRLDIQKKNNVLFYDSNFCKR